MSRTRSNPARQRLQLVAGLLALMTGMGAAAAEVVVVGIPHLRSLEPAPRQSQIESVVDRLAGFAPTLICVEAMPGQSVADLLHRPERTGELLRTFAMEAIRLAPEQQARLSLDAAGAQEAARGLERQPGELDVAARTRLIGLQLASHEPWSAALNWSSLSESEQEEAGKRLGPTAGDRLGTMAASRNEIATVAIPLARRLGHRRLCMADTFIDELDVQSLAGDLLPQIEKPAVREGLERFSRQQAAQWHPEGDQGLVGLLRWTNSDAYAQADRATQWTLFSTLGEGHDIGDRRLAFWHARNAQVAAEVFRGMASAEGGRTLLLIGAAHRPFVEALLASQPWTTVHPAMDYLVEKN
jgi:hypothetical protein